jgi:peroxiredoxin
VALVFYRGGWCPYCNRHLSALQTVHDELSELGFALLAVSPDRPERLPETAAKNEVGYRLLSDSKLWAARSFGLVFQMPREKVTRYREQYNIDLEAWSGQEHHQLPVPAVYLIDRNGRIEFAHYDPDYKQRLDPDRLLAEAREMAARPDPS